MSSTFPVKPVIVRALSGASAPLLSSSSSSSSSAGAASGSPLSRPHTPPITSSSPAAASVVVHRTLSTSNTPSRDRDRERDRDRDRPESQQRDRDRERERERSEPRVTTRPQWAIDLENELDEGRAKLVTMASEDAAVAREVNQARYGVQASLVDMDKIDSRLEVTQAQLKSIDLYGTLPAQFTPQFTTSRVLSQ